MNNKGYRGREWAERPEFIYSCSDWPILSQRAAIRTWNCWTRSWGFLHMLTNNYACHSYHILQEVIHYLTFMHTGVSLDKVPPYLFCKQSLRILFIVNYLIVLKIYWRMKWQKAIWHLLVFPSGKLMYLKICRCGQGSMKLWAPWSDQDTCQACHSHSKFLTQLLFLEIFRCIQYLLFIGHIMMHKNYKQGNIIHLFLTYQQWHETSPLTNFCETRIGPSIAIYTMAKFSSQRNSSL